MPTALWMPLLTPECFAFAPQGCFDRARIQAETPPAGVGGVMFSLLMRPQSGRQLLLWVYACQ